MSSLRNALEALTVQFTEGLLEAIRSASLDELVGSERPRRLNGGRAAAKPAKGEATAAKPRKTATASGRLPRRSAEDIAAVLDQIVALLKKNKDGLRAEMIREYLGLQAKELPRVLKEGIASRKLKSKGQKRATTYYAT
jgi:hypothetical protein